MFGWFRRVPKPPSKRLVDLENDLGDAQAAIAWLRKAVTDLNARLSTVQRQQKPPEDAPEATNGDEPVPTRRGDQHPTGNLFRSRRPF